LYHGAGIPPVLGRRLPGVLRPGPQDVRGARAIVRRRCRRSWSRCCSRATRAAAQVSWSRRNISRPWLRS